MKKMILKSAVLSLFAAAMVAAPTPIRAQAAATNVPAAVSDQPAPAKHKKHDHAAFNGKLTAVDTNAMTLTVDTRTFEITSETKITKDTLPATLEDGVVGETAAGTYKKSADGKLTATSIRFGANADGGKKKKKKTNPESTGSSTNGVPN